MTITEHKPDVKSATAHIVSGLNTDGAHHKQRDMWNALVSLVGGDRARELQIYNGFDKGIQT